MQGPRGFILWSGPERGLGGLCRIWILFCRRTPGSREVLDSWGTLSGRKGRQPPLQRKRPPSSSKESVKGLNGMSCPAGFIIQTVRLRVRGCLAASNRGGSRICRREGVGAGWCGVGWRGEGRLETCVGRRGSRFPPSLPTHLLCEFEQVTSPFCKMRQLEGYLTLE